MGWALDILSGIAMGQIPVNIQNNRTTGLADVLIIIQILHAVLKDANKNATVKQKIYEVVHINSFLSLYIDEFKGTSVNLNCHQSCLSNSLGMGLPEELDSSIQLYRHVPRHSSW